MNRIGRVWYFQTFLRNAPRVGALGKVFGTPHEGYSYYQEVERLTQLYLSGNLSRELESQFVQWLKSQQVITK